MFNHKENYRVSSSGANFPILETKTARRCSEIKKSLRLKCGLLVAINFYIRFDEDMIKLILILNTYYGLPLRY